MLDALSTDPSEPSSPVQGWEVRDSDGNWKPVEPGFDPAGLEPFGEGLWRFPEEVLEENHRPKRSLVGAIFRISGGLLLENPEPQRNPAASLGWGERVLDDQVPGTEIYRDAQGKYVFRHVGAYHHLLNGTAKYKDGSIGRETTLTHPDGRVFHASGHTVYPDGRSLDRRKGLLTALGGDYQQLKRLPEGGWDVPVST